MFFFFNDTATTEIYTLSLHDALPILRLDGLLHVAFLRSQHAHARLTSVDASAARARPGVVAVYTAGDLGDYWRPGPLQIGTAHVCTPVTVKYRMPASAWKIKNELHPP